MLASARSLRQDQLSRHYPVGASTGYMAYHRGDWTRLVSEALGISSFAIELSALSERELPSLIEFLSRETQLPFRYISVHAPSKGMAMPESELTQLLAELPRWIDAIVVHPDVIKDPENYAPLGRRLVIENMDDRKGNGRDASELRGYFDALPQAGLCFDIAHAASVDETMARGAEILDAFTGRLRHVHLSSLDADSHHVRLSLGDAERFSELLDRCRDVPWILEAPPPNE
jgi:Xylose isomerase-like TIM barrel